MQLPMLGMYPATDDIEKPPDIVPIIDYLNPVFPFPKKEDEIYVQITLAVIEKYILRGPTKFLVMLYLES
jgi:hypothetical protein